MSGEGVIGVEAQVLAILSEVCGVEAAELEPGLDLFENGLLDSFGVVDLLVELEAQLGAVLDIAQLTREEIATPALLVRRVERAL